MKLTLQMLRDCEEEPLKRSKATNLVYKSIMSPSLSSEVASAGTGSPGAAPKLGLMGENAPWVLAYTLVALFTGAFFMADTVDYVSSAYLHEFGTNWVFWDFRHLLWRPLGWLIFHVLKPWTVGNDESDGRREIVIVFLTINWICGLAALLLTRSLVHRFSLRRFPEFLSTACFLFSLAFLNYIHSGSSYIPGLACLLLGLYEIVQAGDSPSASGPLKAALALALAVCLWFPYVFAVPGALLLPTLIPSFKAKPWPFTLWTTLICLVFGVAGYGTVLAHLGIHTVGGAREWIQSESKDVGSVPGSARAVFGFARSFLDMGADAVLFKRFMVHDRYNPVTPFQLFRLSLWKLALFYIFLASILAQLFRSRTGRNILSFFLISAAPTFIFGLLWRGGDVERYLPLYPALFIAMAFALSEKKKANYLKWISGAFLVACMISNLAVTSGVTLAKQRSQMAARLQDLLPRLTPNTRVVVVDIHDDAVNFARTFPLDPINRTHKGVFYPAINSGTAQTCHWQRDLSKTALEVWQEGGQLWISKRLIEKAPERGWNWVDGSDPCVNWGSVSNLFSQVDLGDSVGGADGFALLLPTKKNAELLDSFSSVPKL